MKIGTVYLVFAAWCACHVAGNSIAEVETERIYHGSTGSSHLPDVIRFDLNLDGSTVRLNLIRQSENTSPLSLIFSQSYEGAEQWRPMEDENTRTYRDSVHDAFCKATVKVLDGIKEISYIATFQFASKSYSLIPEGVPGPLEGSDSAGSLVSIDGKIHKLFETGRSLPIESASQEGPLRLMKRSVNKRKLFIHTYAVVEYTAFKKFLDQGKGSSDEEKKQDATRNLLYVMAVLMDHAARIYEKTEFIDFSIAIKWVGTFISENPADMEFLGSSMSKKPGVLSSVDALKGFQTWAFKKEKIVNGKKLTFPKFDYIILMSGYNMDVGGATYGNSICGTGAVGIIKYASIATTAKELVHEIAHNIGSYHDGDGNSCSNKDYKIMTGISKIPDLLLHNTFIFSECSVARIREHIKYLDEIRNNCLLDGFEEPRTGSEPNDYMLTFPGQIYDLDEQCRLYFGPKARYCEGHVMDLRMCKGIKCTDGSSGVCKDEHMIRAMDGTSCSDGSWCVNSTCLRDSRAPKAPLSCVSGDQKSYQVYLGQTLTCKDVTDKYPESCALRDIQENCCASCAGVRTKSGGTCQDTLEECSNLQPRDCYSKFYGRACCKTCEALVQNPSKSDCLYGDRGQGCPLMMPHICTVHTNHCCHSCSELLKTS